MTRWYDVEARPFFMCEKLNLEALFAEFLKERRYLKNITKNTERYYNQSWTAYKEYGGLDAELNRGSLNRWVMNMREAGIKPKSCNTFISAINAFVHWLYDNELIERRIGATLLKVQDELLVALTEKQVLTLANFKPQTKGQWRTHTILSLLIDTGMRIDEALGSLTSNIDFEQSIMTIKGKGGKVRTLPISYEMRKRLWQWLKKGAIIPVRFCFRLPLLIEWSITIFAGI